MATLSQAKSQRMYSWWWDSHISPKNSRWLQENLTDMDSKVKSMIKLIEEDADSFARRAEMYYKKRPELMKLVEEFYRAYRALAERYDHATGALRQAHRTMSEAFPNQIPSLLPDDAPVNSDPRTPEMSTHLRAFLDPDDLQKNGTFREESGDPAKFGQRSVRKSLNFHEAVDSEQVGKSEKEILILKEAIAKLEAEKEAGLNQYQQSLEGLAKLEAEVSRAQDDSRQLREQERKSEAETRDLKDSLVVLEAEKAASLLQYQLCLKKISNLEDSISRSQKDALDLDDRANKAETEAHTLKQDLAKAEAEKDDVLNQYKQSLEMISDLENKLLHTRESAQKYSERAEMAEGEVETLKVAISKLTEEKEAAALQIQQCLETISSLELKLSSANEEAQRLNDKIDSGAEKLKGVEERCVLLERSNQSLHSDMETLVLKMGSQSQELTEKQKELGRLWTCIQEERLRFIEAETAFQTLQSLHAQAQDELRSLALELQNRGQLLKDMETLNESLQNEVLKLKEENKSLNELNLSSSISMKGMQNEIFSLKETNGKLEEEVELRVDQRNALQQEIYCLKEELKDLNNKHYAVLKQVDAVGLNPGCFETSVKELQDENSELRNSYQREMSEKVALLEKLEIYEKLLQKNALLENSLSDLGAEVEAVRGKINVLEESCRSLLQDKSTLVDERATLMTQVQLATENLGKLSETNTVLANSLSVAHEELKVLKEKSKTFEDSCLLLTNQNSGLISEKDTLASQIEITQQRLKDLERSFTELEEKYVASEIEKNLTISEVEELKVYLEIQKQEHVSFAKTSATQLAGLETHVHLLQEESWNSKRELEGERDKALDYDMEIFVLQNCVRDLGEKNLSLIIEGQKLLEESKLSAKLISELKDENIEQQAEVKSLFDQRSTLRIGMYELLKAFDIAPDHGCEDNIGTDKTCLEQILSKVQVIKSSLFEAQDENLLMAVERSVLIALIGQLRLEAANIVMENSITEQELRIRSEQCVIAQNEAHKLFGTAEKLMSELSAKSHKEEELVSQIENLQGKLLDMEEAYENSQEEKAQVLEEKRVLVKELLHMEEKNRTLEEENCAVFSEMLSLSFLSLIFENHVEERSMEIKELHEDLVKLHGANAALEMENLCLKETLHKTEDEFQSVSFVLGHLYSEIASTKGLFGHKEMELLEAERKIAVKEDEKSGFSKIVVDLERELQKRNIEIDLWETQATVVYGELTTSTIAQTLFEEKVHELIEECKSLKDGDISKILKIGLLDERIGILEGQNEELKAQLAPYGPAVTSLMDSISSLEKHTFLHTNLQKSINEEVKEAELGNHCAENHQSEDKNATDPDAISKMQDVQARVKVIENTFLEMERLAMEENLNAYSKLESTMRQMEELRAENHSLRGNVKPKSEISEVETGLLPKDIMLDHISESSSYGRSRRHHFGSDNRMLDLWEITDQESSVDLSVNKGKNVVGGPTKKERLDSMKQKNEYYSSDFLVEKELDVNKLDVSKRFTEPHKEGGKRKILERLNSDVQKLTNLQITVQDLKSKLVIIEKSRRGKAVIESDNMKWKLEEAEVAIQKLFDLNGKLVKNIEDYSSHSGKNSAMESDDSASVRRRRISEQARRVSEKIGRLQLEMQRIQFDLVKLDDEIESKGKIRVAEAKRRVLLKDYLYGGARKSPKTKKKAPFCACIEPPTTGD